MLLRIIKVYWYKRKFEQNLIIDSDFIYQSENIECVGQRFNIIYIC
jgi:hypothetical protein